MPKLMLITASSPEIFQTTLDFLEQAGVQNVTFNILTPHPGTPLFHNSRGSMTSSLNPHGKGDNGAIARDKVSLYS